MHFRSGRVDRAAVRMVTASALALVACGATAAGAQAAAPRIPPPPPQCSTERGLSGNSTAVVALNQQICYGPTGTTVTKYAVVLSRLVNGSWVVLASGTGEVYHDCVGTTSYEYSALGYTYTYACG